MRQAQRVASELEPEEWDTIRMALEMSIPTDEELTKASAREFDRAASTLYDKLSDAGLF